ncbi:unnamed protein product [Phytophthora lilii]|uniref:Unnamed protein product n=1 Tax=Phytophthora lilii TaxID=2077276 RepID=A0A9W6XH01_9STRA|nr:unnamed protein product [Phytophthora lilii]
MTLSFGKYRDLTYEEAFDKDPLYMRWVFANHQLMSRHKGLKPFLTEKFTEDDGTFMMSWGKHKLKSIGWIKENDPKYFKWLSRSVYVKEYCKGLKKAINELLVD